jgi:hypothetical protein
MARDAPPRRPPALAPALALVAASVALTAAVGAVTGWREVGDDAPHLLELVRSPWILLAAPESSGLSPTWRSFPPLLPATFGLLVRPWLAWLPDFLGLRFGVLSWALVALLVCDALAARLGFSRAERSRALWIFASASPLLGSIALLPQEEVYLVPLVAALFAAGSAGRPWLVAALAALSMLAGKILLGLLVVPIACYSARPAVELARSGAAMAGALGAYLAWHALHHGSVPLLGYEVAPGTSISAWAVLAGLGLPLPRGAGVPSLALTVAVALATAVHARRRAVPVLHASALVLLLPLFTLSIAMPPYIVWGLPLVALVLARSDRSTRAAGIVLVGAWGAVAYASKLLAGVALALSAHRPQGKRSVAELAERLLGSDFPYEGTRTALLVLLVGLGIALAAVVWRAGLAREARRPPAPGPSEGSRLPSTA